MKWTGHAVCTEYIRNATTFLLGKINSKPRRRLRATINVILKSMRLEIAA
jgi:hypothetical protein